MPIYEYRCTACETQFEELLLSRAEEKDVRCPSCGAADVTRELSITAATSAGGCGPGGGRGPIG
jgi:putative FmdB family regulatory protein